MNFLAAQARLAHQRYLNALDKLDHLIFDEMESFEHSKLKPLSIPIFVTRKRKILAADVAQMPAKGLIAEAARKKYGYRADHRPKVVQRLLTELKRHVSEDLQVLSDQNPKYPVWIKTQFPNATHEATKGRRGCVTGQGELKALQWDPLFALNHTAAMLRANMNRLFRKTWCTTKTPQGLKNHIDIYINFHNNVLTA